MTLFYVPKHGNCIISKSLWCVPQIQVWRSEHELLYDSCHLLAKCVALIAVPSASCRSEVNAVKDVISIRTPASLVLVLPGQTG